MKAIFLLAIVCAISLAFIERTPMSAHAQEILCQQAPHREKSDATFDAGKTIIVITCGGLRGRAAYDDKTIALSVSDIAGKPVFGKTNPDAFTLYEPLLRSIVTENPNIGAWTLSIRGYDAYGSRLAAAAAADPAWDANNGRPRTGAIASYVKDLGKRAHVFDELEHLAGKLGLQARLLAVENVELCRFPSRSKTMAPCGGLMWFLLQH